MFKTLTQRLKGKVDKEAEAKKKGIEYVIKLAESKKDILSKYIKKGSKGTIEEEVYSLMLEALNFSKRCDQGIVSVEAQNDNEMEKYSKTEVSFELGFVCNKEHYIIDATEEGKIAYQEHQRLIRI